MLRTGERAGGSPFYRSATKRVQCAGEIVFDAADGVRRRGQHGTTSASTVCGFGTSFPADGHAAWAVSHRVRPKTFLLRCLGGPGRVGRRPAFWKGERVVL